MTEQTIEIEKAKPLTFGRWWNFMLGRRDAIDSVARSTNALWVGLLFVLSAGLAREYDGEYLVREPWHLLLPLGASLVTSLVLYALVYLAASGHGVTKLRWWAGYRTLLTFYWMTAPLAWLYAVPVERFLSPGQATKVNLTLLAIVSVWRVLLITRAISVWLAGGFFSLLLVVLFFSNTVLSAASVITPTPIWDIMGGIRLPERESIILGAKLFIWFFGTISWFVLLIATCAVGLIAKSPWYSGALPKPRTTNVGRSLWAFAILLLGIGLSILPLAQPEQARRWHAEHLLRSGQIAEGLRFIAATPQSDFPPQWDPPPRTGYSDDQPDPRHVIDELKKFDAPEWLRDRYIEKMIASHSGIHSAIESAERGDPESLNSILDYLERAKPGGYTSEFNWEFRRTIERKKFPDETQERITKFLEREK